MMQNYINYFDHTDKIFLTLSIVILVTLVIYKITSRFGKPLVFGGIISGMILSYANIPTSYFDISSCSSLGNTGLILFMMLLGSQLDFKQFSNKKTNILTASISMLVPFILGVAFVPKLIQLGYVNQHQQEHIITFAIFIGLSLSMAAFPIVSMFIGQTNLIKSSIGQFALFIAAIDEIIFWCVLVVILIYFQQNGIINTYHPIYAFSYLLFVFLVVPHLIKLITDSIKSQRAMLGFMIGGCLISTTLAEAANLHPVIGGFLFGIMLPRENLFIKHIRHQLNDFVNIILLPIYFVKTGMDATLQVSFNLTTIYVGGMFTIIALLGKFVGSYLTGKILGYTQQESALLGFILNIRGVLEIALLNLGLEVGFISNEIYSTLIIMTLITTWIATSATMWLHKKSLKLNQINTQSS